MKYFLKKNQTKAVRLLSWLLAFSLVILVLDLPKPHQTVRAANNVLLFWAGGAAPTGWTIDTTYDDKMIRGNSTAGPPGEAILDTHTHSISWVSSKITVTPTFGGSNTGVASSVHEHSSLGSSSMDTGSHLPPYRTLKVISCDAGTSCTVPDDGIAIFDAVPTSGTWTRYSAQDDKFIRGSGTVGSTGGATTHSHTNTDITTSGPSDDVAGTGGFETGPTSSHTHTASGTAGPDGHIPSNVDVLLYQNTLGSAQDVPAGMIAMFNGTIGSGYDSISDSAETFYEKFMEAKSSYAASGGGATTHTHSNAALVSGTTASTSTIESGPAVQVPIEDFGGHTHAIGISFGTANNLPDYVDVIIGQKLSYTPATRNWQWFDEEDDQNPNDTVGGETTTGDAMAAEDTAPAGTRVVYDENAFKLRWAMGETAGAGGTDVKFWLQYDTTTDFLSPTTLTAYGSCTSKFCYYDGDNVTDDDAITTNLLTGITGDGRHNEDSGTGSGEGSTMDPAASTDYEYEFTMINNDGTANTTYYFRAMYCDDSQAGVCIGDPVALGSGEAYPSAKTSAAYDLETYQVPATVSLGSYTKGSGGTLQYVFQAGEEVVLWDKRGNAPGVTVTVNAFSMDCASPVDTLPGTSITWTSAAGSLNGSFASDTTGATGNDGQTMDSNRTAYSLGSSADKTVRTGGFYFLPTIDLAGLDSEEVCNYTGTLQVTIA